VLLATTLALSKVERDIAQQAPRSSEPEPPAKPLGQIPMFFIASMVILSLGYQLHFAINSAPFFLRFAKPRRVAVAVAGVLDRLQYRDASGERCGQAPRWAVS